MKKEHLIPFLKWPGGKRWLMEKYKNYFPDDVHQLYEPFLGGGAAFFYLMPNSAILSDINSDLINLYQVMKDNHSELALYMRQHQSQHCKDYYYRRAEKGVRANQSCHRAREYAAAQCGAGYGLPHHAEPGAVAERVHALGYPAVMIGGDENA